MRSDPSTPIVIALGAIGVVAVVVGVVTSRPEPQTTPVTYEYYPTVAVAAAPQTVSGVQDASPDTWVTSTVTRTGIPARALDAYVAAAQESATTNPECGLGWNTIAAIGAVESGHGTHGGTYLLADGQPAATIMGPALDGRPGFAAIAATELSQRWTGDPHWDHAVGPMQFLTSTWTRWGIDADGDEVANPHDMDDAALATANYLCAAGGDLRTAEGWARAVRAYNHSDEYVAQVAALANEYGRSQ